MVLGIFRTNFSSAAPGGSRHHRRHGPRSSIRRPSQSTPASFSDPEIGNPSASSRHQRPCRGLTDHNIRHTLLGPPSRGTRGPFLWSGRAWWELAYDGNKLAHGIPARLRAQLPWYQHWLSGVKDRRITSRRHAWPRVVDAASYWHFKQARRWTSARTSYTFRRKSRWLADSDACRT